MKLTKRQKARLKKEFKTEGRKALIAFSRVSVLMYLFYTGLYFSQEAHQNIAWSLVAMYGLIYLYGFEYTSVNLKK